MASPESASNEQKDEPGPPFVLARRFQRERQAGQAYFKAQEAIFQTEHELSAYRFQMPRGVWHVAVVGVPPPQDVQDQLELILSTGVETTLPDEITSFLFRRQAQAKKLGPWVEGHYRE